MESVEFRRGKHNVEIEAVVGHHNVIPYDFIQRIRDVLRGLESETLGAFGAIERGSFNKLGKGEVTRNDEGAGARKMFSGSNRPE